MAQLVKKKKKKNLPAIQETWVQPLDWEYPLEKGTATHSFILAWRIPREEKKKKERKEGIVPNSERFHENFVCLCQVPSMVLNTVTVQ